MKHAPTFVCTSNLTAHSHISSGSMTGTNIPTGFCVLHPTRHYGHRILRGALYGQVVPHAEADAHMQRAGYITEYRHAREDGMYYFGALRKSWRKRGLGVDTLMRYLRRTGAFAATPGRLEYNFGNRRFSCNEPVRSYVLQAQFIGGTHA